MKFKPQYIVAAPCIALFLICILGLVCKPFRYALSAEWMRSKSVKVDTVRVHDTVKCTVFVVQKRVGPKPITQGEIERWE